MADVSRETLPINWGGKMKAAIYKGEKSIELESAERPAPGPGYVLLEMKNCGVCGSEIGRAHV